MRTSHETSFSIRPADIGSDSDSPCRVYGGSHVPLTIEVKASDGETVKLHFHGTAHEVFADYVAKAVWGSTESSTERTPVRYAVVEGKAAEVDAISAYLGRGWVSVWRRPR